ncbi:MAG: hypothetical protein P4M13_05855 [Alphaproteobacteria bacterium]|nr:hypothetical protein [Alphaproteobacteria bacterium]
MSRKKQPKQISRRLLGNEEHIARYCYRQQILRDPETGDVISILDSFKLRPIDKGELSVDQFEKLGNDFNARLKTAVSTFRSMIKHSPVTADSMISVLNVGAVKEIGRGAGKELKVKDKSRPDRPTYAHLLGLPHDNSDNSLLASLSDEGIKSCHFIEVIDKLP